jgi:hypothetical protein
MLYRLLGMAVWKALKWLVRNQFGKYVPPSRRVLAAAAVGSAIIGLIFAQRREA